MESTRKTAMLTKIKFGTMQRLSREFIDAQVDVEIHPDYFTIIGKGYLWGEEVAHEEVSYPKDWWQAFRERWIPKWILGRFPVEYRTVVMDAKLIYPKLRPSLPKEPHFLIINKSNAIWDSQPPEIKDDDQS